MTWEGGVCWCKFLTILGIKKAGMQIFCSHWRIYHWTIDDGSQPPVLPLMMVPNLRSPTTISYFWWDLMRRMIFRRTARVEFTTLVGKKSSRVPVRLPGANWPFYWFWTPIRIEGRKILLGPVWWCFGYLQHLVKFDGKIWRNKNDSNCTNDLQTRSTVWYHEKSTIHYYSL